MSVCFLGNTNVGKTHIINTLLYPLLDYTPIVTIGVNFYTYSYRLINKSVKIKLFDVSANKSLKFLYKNIIDYVDFSIIVVDLNNLDSINYYIELIKNDKYHILINSHLDKTDNSNIINRLKNKYKGKISLIDSYNTLDVRNKLELIFKKMIN